MMRKIAIITARGGSKRIPKKNIKPFHGKPIIAYSIEAALKANIFSEVMVSTDDQEIKEIALKYGALVPFLRSERNSDDFSTTSDVIEEVLNEYAKINIQFDYACCIYPTAPFVTSEKLVNAYEKLVTSSCKSLVPIVKFGFPIQRSFKIENDKMVMNWPENINVRSQDLLPAYHDAGQFYFLKIDSFLKEKKIFTDETIGFEMDENEVQDIDNLVDWKLAEIKYQFLLNRE
jgi:pseudaminic acid cytidylyltransferase